MVSNPLLIVHLALSSSPLHLAVSNDAAAIRMQNRKTGELLRIIDRGTGSMSSILAALVFNLVPTMADIAIAAVYFCLAFELTISVVILTSLPSTDSQSSPLPRPAFPLPALRYPPAPSQMQLLQPRQSPPRLRQPPCLSVHPLLPTLAHAALLHASKHWFCDSDCLLFWLYPTHTFS